MQVDFSVELGRDDPALEVPWSSDDPSVRYYDLKAAPELVAQLPEAVAHPQLGAFFTRINAAGFPLATAKCDAWHSRDIAPEEEVFGGDRKFVSYVDLVFQSDDDRCSLEKHEALAQELCRLLAQAPNIAAAVEIVIRRCYFHRCYNARPSSSAQALPPMSNEMPDDLSKVSRQISRASGLGVTNLAAMPSGHTRQASRETHHASDSPEPTLPQRGDVDGGDPAARRCSPGEGSQPSHTVEQSSVHETNVGNDLRQEPTSARTGRANEGAKNGEPACGDAASGSGASRNVAGAAASWDAASRGTANRDATSCDAASGDAMSGNPTSAGARLDASLNGFCLTAYVTGFGDEENEPCRRWEVALALMQNALVQVSRT